MPRGLGFDQREVLRLMAQFGHWNRRAGWHWYGISRTERMLDRLVSRGLVRVEIIRDPIGTSEINHYTLVKP